MLDKLDKIINDLERPEITVEELVQWKNHPVTRLLFCDFIEEYMDNLEFLSENIPVDDEARATHARKVGEQGTIKDFLDYFANAKAELEEKEKDSGH